MPLTPPATLSAMLAPACEPAEVPVAEVLVVVMPGADMVRVGCSVSVSELLSLEGDCVIALGSRNGQGRWKMTAHNGNPDRFPQNIIMT